MELKQSTFEELVESQRSLVLSAEARYGKYYFNARACSIFLSRSIESVEHSHHDTFGRFFAQLRWLDQNFPAGSQAIKEKKGLINVATSHANIVSANQLFRVDDQGDRVEASFFDIEDDYHVQIDLWLISSIGVEMMDLLWRVNQTRNAIGFVENFPEYLHHVARQNEALHGEITSTPRYERAMAFSKQIGKNTPKE
jgi:hypothetical protein